jgi:hypothetical protein
MLPISLRLPAPCYRFFMQYKMPEFVSEREPLMRDRMNHIEPDHSSTSSTVTFFASLGSLSRQR